jgi:hypothetical protein
MGEQLDLKEKTKENFESNSKKIIIAIDSAFAKKDIKIFGCQKRAELTSEQKSQLGQKTDNSYKSYELEKLRKENEGLKKLLNKDVKVDSGILPDYTKAEHNPLLEEDYEPGYDYESDIPDKSNEIDYSLAKNNILLEEDMEV